VFFSLPETPYGASFSKPQILKKPLENILQKTPSFTCISTTEARELIEANDVTLLDVRDLASFTASNIENSIHVSDRNVEQIVASADKDQPLLVYCYHGNSSKGAADYFFREGFTKSYSIDGGFEDWRLKYPVSS
jgi:thiosulfate sulfurtransferase